jgi:hypothetical protein
MTTDPGRYLPEGLLLVPLAVFAVASVALAAVLQIVAARGAWRRHTSRAEESLWAGSVVTGFALVHTVWVLWRVLQGRDAWILWMMLLGGAGLVALPLVGGLAVGTVACMRGVVKRAAASGGDVQAVAWRVVGWWALALVSPYVLLPLVASWYAGPEESVFVVLRALGTAR